MRKIHIQRALKQLFAKNKRARIGATVLLAGFIVTILLTFWHPPQAYASIGHVRENYTNGNGNVESLTFSPTTAVAAGHHALVFVQVTAGTGQLITCSTNATGATAQIDIAQAPASNVGQGICSIYAPNGISTSDTITAAVTAGKKVGGIAVEEFSGLATSNWFDKSATNYTASLVTTLDSGTTPTTTQSKELVVSHHTVLNVGHTFTKDTNYSLFPAGTAGYGTNQQSFDQYRVVSSTGTQSATASWTNANSPSASIATYKAAIASWYNASWSCRKEITVDRTKVTADQTDFPVLINLSSDSDLSSGARSDGNDILFTSTDGTTKLKHEIEKYTSGTGELQAWVKVPALSSSTNTDLFMYYCNSGATSQQDAVNVWDTNFKGIYHLSDSSGTTITDSTGNFTGAKVSSSSPTSISTSQIAGGQSYNGTSDEVTISSGPNLTTNATIEGWFYWDSSDPDTAGLIRDHTSAAGTGWLMPYNGGSGLFSYRMADTTFTTSINMVPYQNKWTHYAMTKSGSNVALYLDGSSVNTNTGAANTANVIGWHIMKNGSNSSNGFLKGKSDEIRFSDSPRSPTWIQTEYNNQFSPSNFYTLGSQELSNSPPNAPTLSSPSNATTVASITPTLQFSSIDPNSDAVRYQVQVDTTNTFNSGQGGTSLINATSGTHDGFSGSPDNTDPYTSGQTVSYTTQINLTRGTTYYWQVRAIDPTGSNTWSSYASPQTFTVSSIPATPTLSTPGSGSTNISVLPRFTLRTTDADADYLKYYIEIYDATACGGALVRTMNQTSDQTGWEGQNQQTSTAYTGAANIGGSTVATHSYQAPPLLANHLYSWKAKAKDPGGSDTFSSFTSCQDFTTSTREVQIQGGVDIRGGTVIQ